MHSITIINRTKTNMMALLLIGEQTISENPADFNC